MQSSIGAPAGVRALNPDAGSHAVTGDPGEVAAARRAAACSLAQFPYYEQRYGERGRHFALSDSAWLAMLVDADALGYDSSWVEHRAREKVGWLGRVLSARGMPRWLLECHLDVLHAELTRAAPARETRYAVLARCADDLRAQRQSQLRDVVRAELAAAFDARVGRRLAQRHPHIGSLLVAAVADEGCGIANAVPSLTIWACDPARWAPRWVDAARATIDAARARRVGPSR